MDFNPLDLLAAAAALQRDDPKKAKKTGGKSPSETDCDDNNTDEAAEEEDSNKSDKMGSARKVRSEIKRQNSCTLPSEVGKLFGAESGRSVDTVSEEDLPGRTLRRHSWSADGGTVARDSACDTDIPSKDSEDPVGGSKSVSSDSGTAETHVTDDPAGSVCEAEVQQTESGGDLTVNPDDRKASESAGESEMSSSLNSKTDVSVDAGGKDDAKDGAERETNNERDVDSRSACCPLCLAENDTDQAFDENSLCATCGRTVSAKEAEDTKEAADTKEVSNSGNDEPETQTVASSEKSEASFIAVVDERTCSESPERVENKGTSCLLESYLTSVQTGKPGHSLVMNTGVGQGLEECDDSNEDDCETTSSGISPASSVVFDHSYASQPGREVNRSSRDYYDTEHGVESDSCGENSSTEEVEHRARSMSMESACLRFAFDDKQMTLPMKGHEDSDHMSTEASLLSPTSSVDSSLTDYPPLKLTPLSLPDKNMDTSVQQTLIQGYSSSDGCDDRLGSPTSSVESLQGQIPSKIGKFRIGTFASFSSSNLKSDTGPRNGSKSIRFKDHSTLSAPFFDKGIIGSPPSVPQSPGIPSFLQSPCGDWDRSDAGSEVQDELGPPHCSETYNSVGSQDSSEAGFLDMSSVYHDHDYCLREGHVPKDYGIDSNTGKAEKRKYSSWTKAKSGMVRHIKEPKVKSKARVKKIKVEMPESPSLVTSLPEEVSDFKQPFEVDMSQDRANSVIGRTSRRRLEKLERLQEQLELDNGSKLKITGKFKDDYVYYLNKSSRSRRRASTDLPPPPPTDKIILPAPKPGDIIVPHLTDADIEAIKLRGKSGLSISEKYYGAGLSSALHSGTNLPPIPSHTEIPSHPPESMADMDSKIINTILSMENDSLGSPASAHESSMSDTVELYSPSEETVGISFMGENMTLTQDQVNLLLDAVKDVETSPEEIIESSAAMKYNLDNNQNYDQPVEHLEISTSDQKSIDGASTTDETERRHSVSSAASELEPEHKDCADVTEAEGSTIDNPVCSVTASESLSITSIASVPVSTAPSVVVPPTVNPNESPVKALLEADLQTIGESAPLRDLIHTIEKPFDLLGNDFRLDKSDLFPEAAVMDQTAPCVPSSTPSLTTSTSSDYNTPWIVTVTMFWNDLPAIMIDNQPFVRLVDIHKQILPAKDTGILKKRCQLLGIEVLNCSEMQRYFLVQYGRAYNSKSTLIVSKDNAKDLIGYYVNPQPRVSKLEDVRREDPELAPDTSVSAPQSVESNPAKTSTPIASKKKIRSKALPKLPTVVKTDVTPAPVQPVQMSSDVQPPVVETVSVAAPQVSKRLRHKKINFLELLRGEVNSEPYSGNDSTEEKKVEKEEEDQDESSRKVASPASPNSKRKAKLSDAEKLKLVKEELKKRKIELPDESAPDKKIPRVVERDSEEENHSTPARRRVPGSRPKGANPINGNRRSRLNKVGPLKVKIKGLLHFKKGKKKNELDNKVIEIRHKDPKPTNTHPSVTQDGDIHLDLYQKKSSLCIKCCSCKKFFSLRNFLTHQHYPDDTEILTTVAQPQILEPRNSKLSEKKQTLWQEFNIRRKQLEGTKPVSDPKPVVVSKPLNIVNTVIPTSPTASAPEKPEAVHNSQLPEDIPAHKPESALEAELRKKTDIPRFKQPVTIALSSRRKPSSSGVRVSSRKRKERQLFPIENYSFSKKAARLDMPLNGNVAVELDQTASVSSSDKAAAAASNCVLTLSNGPELTHYTALQDAPEL